MNNTALGHPLIRKYYPISYLTFRSLLPWIIRNRTHQLISTVFLQVIHEPLLSDKSRIHCNKPPLFSKCFRCAHRKECQTLRGIPVSAKLIRVKLARRAAHSGAIQLLPDCASRLTTAPCRDPLKATSNYRYSTGHKLRARPRYNYVKPTVDTVFILAVPLATTARL
jgi:hypothetical protein